MDRVLSKIVKLSTNGRRILVDPKRKVVTECTGQIAGSANKSLTLRSPLNKLGKRKRSNNCENKCSSCSRRTFLKNYSSFTKSGVLQRLLFSQDGQWVDFPQEVVNFVKEDFRSKRASIEVKCDGCHFMLDILRMVQVDLKTGAQKPIAWIDDSGTCVFPESYSSCHGNHDDQGLGESSNTPEINLNLDIKINGLDNNKDDECVGESNVKRVKVDQELPKNNLDLAVVEKQKSDEYASPILGTTCGRVDLETAKNMFIAGLGSAVKVDIFEVKKFISSFRESQHELFQKQVEFTQKLRGTANVQFGWYVAAGDAPSGVMFYGLDGPKLGKYGYGIHLAAVQSAHLRTIISDDDEKEIKHLVLCRVILGNAEVVHAGSKQFSPSDPCFDSGVDDLQNPNNYVIWNVNMNTHIFPECVISFKTSPTIKGNPVGEESRLRVATTHDPHEPLNQEASSNDKTGKTDPQVEVVNLPSHEKVPSVGSSTPKGPKSPWIPFTMLLESISPNVAPNKMRLLRIFYESLKDKKINRDEFVRKLRSVVGDPILRSSISVLQTKKNPNPASMPEGEAQETCNG